MEIGISSYTFTWAVGVPGDEPSRSMEYRELLKKAKDLDVSILQIADNLPLHHLPDLELIRYSEEANREGISLEVGARGMTESWLDKYIEISRLVGSPLLRFVIDGPDFQPDIGTIISIIRNALTTLRDKNITLVLENYERLKAEEFAAIIEAISDDHVGICLDTVNSLGAGESLETVVRLLGPLTLNLHVKEFTIKRIYHKMGFQIEGLPAGEGSLNLPLILEHLNPGCHSAILEQWTPPENSLEKTIEKENKWAAKSICYLKKIIN